MPMPRCAVITLLLFCTTASAQSPVRVETVSNQTIVRQIDVSGTVTSPRVAVLSPAVAGLVARLIADEGDRVTTGDPLLELDAELARLALERSLAQVRQEEATTAEARRRFTEAEKVGTARGIARTEIESLRAGVAIAEASLAAARAAAREQEAIVARHVVRAPFAGVISERFADPGEWVNPGNSLLELVATDDLRFDFQVGQDFFSALAPGTPVSVSLDALPGATLVGRVDTVIPVKNPGARTFLVRVLAEQDSALSVAGITPGMSARGRLNIDSGRSGVAVSRDALLRFPDGRVTVWVVETDGELPKAREQVVTTGFEHNGLVEIVSGLADGDQVVVRGNETLQPGQEVSLVAGDR